MLRPYKFLVMPILQEVDVDGNVINERQPEQPDVVFGINNLREYAEQFEHAVAQLDAQNNSRAKEVHVAGGSDTES